MAHSFWPFAQPAEVGQMLCGAIQMIIVKHFHVPFLQTESIRKHTHNTIYTSSKFMQILARVVGDDPTDGILLVVIGHKIIENQQTKHVEGWIKVHVGIQCVCVCLCKKIQIDRKIDKQIDR